ncbi:hypothetical protein [Pararhodonellum marinum]|uniref:hypothetical protein n=1 Tax=Pararhodonellum marinum TaxID=2755358 RepID=UPI00188E0314|nr:hypothetical protein [Pararhodonellum marinum]
MGSGMVKFGFIALLVYVACVGCDDLFDLEELKNCPPPLAAEVTGLSQVFYEPFENRNYSTEMDTVPINAFRFNVEIELDDTDFDEAFFIGQGFSTDCPVYFNFQNLSLIQVILTEPFEDLAKGTDISFLLILPDGTQLSRFRDFSKTDKFITTRLNKNISGLQQLHTETILFFRNGERVEIASTSPVLKN